MRLAALLAACAVSAWAPSFAHASHAPLHLWVSQLKLEPVVASRSSLPKLQLTAPCLGCLATPSRARVTLSALKSRRAPPRAVRPQSAGNRAYLGDTWSFGKGRELSIHLTPNEGHCAPLMRLTF
jgi:hypothetical protein